MKERGSLAGPKHEPHKLDIMGSNPIPATINGREIYYVDVSLLTYKETTALIEKYRQQLDDPFYPLKKLIEQAESWKDGREA